jgi:hypothetical protein
MNSEEEIRQKIHKLKVFYTNLLIYGVICFSAIIVWVSMGCGPFWPVWVILACGFSSALQAADLGKFPRLYSLFPFLQKEWENEQIQDMIKKKPPRQGKK